jgi:hypothetical protein
MPEAAKTSLTELPPHLVEYRKHLVGAEQKSQEDFDKTVLSLSGGALGISFVFLKDVVGANPVLGPGWLLAAWISWGTSSLSVLASYFMSHLALRAAISQVDDGTIYSKPAGGVFRRWTAILNAAGAILFLSGVLFITVFAGTNLLSKGAQSGTVTQNTTTTPTSATSTESAAAGREKPATDAGLYPSRPATSASAIAR